MITVYLFLFLRSLKTPLFLLTEDALVLARKRFSIPLAEITDIRDAGKESLEIVLQGSNTVQVYLHELSAEDQAFLRNSLRRSIQKKGETRQT